MSKLITYSYFRGETDISANVDDIKLDNPIKKAQDRLKALIGPTFYDELVAQVITTPKTLTAANTSVFDPYIKQFLAWQAYEFYIVKAGTYDSRIGPRVFREENSDPVSDKIMGEQIAAAKRDAQFYKEALLNFLRSAQRVSSLAYPLYTNKATCIESGFGISAISKTDTVSLKIENQIINQEP
jgi:hypothetical protein